jgi:Outer membrane protein beta-barrel domain
MNRHFKNNFVRMKKSLLLFLILFIFQLPVLIAVEFSPKEKAVIYTNAIKVLETYQTIINDIGTSAVTDIEKAKSSSESFLELFVNRQVLLFNDLDPSHKLSEFYEAETYSSNVILWYPDGITIDLDLTNARVSDIMQHEEIVYSIDLVVTKSINGNYLNETMNNNKEELTFRIAFGLENKNLTNFKIVGIRSAASNIVVDYSQTLKEVNSEKLSIEDLDKIYGEIKTVLQDYTNFLSLLGDPQETDEDKEFYKTSFLKLFQNDDTRLYNDIMPDPPVNLISVKDYLNNYKINFPNGINNVKINSDSAKFGKVMRSEDESYYTYVDANKFFSGSFREKEVHRKMFPLIFKISFSESGKTFNNFVINSIDISSTDFYEDTPEGMLQKKPSMIIQPVSRKGLALSFIASFGQANIINKNLESITLENNYHEWNVSTLYGYVGSIGISYYYNDHVALRTGLEFNNLSTRFSLNGLFTDSVNLFFDPNDRLYNKKIEADFDSLVTINQITVPILINYTSGKPGKLGFYAEGGAKVSISLKSTYTNTGNYNYMGWFPGDPYGGDKTTEIWGYYSRENINETAKAKTSLFYLSFYSSAGINIPLGYYSSIMVGPEVSIGISDIMNNQNFYTDIFGNILDHKPTKMNYFGFKISLAYKL